MKSKQLFGLVVLAALSITACAKDKNQGKSRDSDSVTRTEVLSAEATQEQSAIVIDAQGVGPVRLGMTIKELPAKADGLYDNIVEENSDMVLYSFYKDGETVMTTNGDGKIEIIEVFAQLTDVNTPDGVHQGMKEAEFKKLSGWQPTGDEGGYTKDGVTVYVRDGEVSNLQTGSFEADI